MPRNMIEDNYLYCPKKKEDNFFILSNDNQIQASVFQLSRGRKSLGVSYMVFFNILWVGLVMMDVQFSNEVGLKRQEMAG